MPSYAPLQHLPSYLGFSYLGHGVTLHGCSSKVQPLLLTLDKGYLLTATLPDLQRGMAPLGPPALMQPLLLGLLLQATAPGLLHSVAPQGHHPWPRVQGGFSWPPLTSDTGCLLLAATDLGCGVAPLGRLPWPRTRGVSSQPPLTSDLGNSSGLFLRRHSLALSAAAPHPGCGVTPPGLRLVCRVAAARA